MRRRARKVLAVARERERLSVSDGRRCVCFAVCAAGLMRRAHAPVPCVHAGEGETRGGERQSRRRTSDQRWAGRGASTTIERATSSPQQGSKACCHVRSKSQRSVCTGRNLTRLAAFFVDSGAGRSIDARTWDGGQWWVGGRPGGGAVGFVGGGDGGGRWRVGGEARQRRRWRWRATDVSGRRFQC